MGTLGYKYILYSYMEALGNGLCDCLIWMFRVPRAFNPEVNPESPEPPLSLFRLQGA